MYVRCSLTFYNYIIHTCIDFSVPIAKRFTNLSLPPVTKTRPVSPISRHDTFCECAVISSGNVF